MEVALGVGLHEELVELVGDAAAVLDGGHHVAHGLPGRAGRALGVHLQQVVLQRPRLNCTSIQAPPCQVALIRAAKSATGKILVAIAAPSLAK